MHNDLGTFVLADAAVLPLIDNQFVVSKPDVIRQETRIALVDDIVIEMCKKGSPWPQVSDQVQGFFEAKMC